MKQEQQRPTTDEPDAWRQYWANVQPPEWSRKWGYWRTQPEVDEERQQYLAARQAVKPDVEKGIYPFRDENGSIKLTRADVEWLLATHMSGERQGPVDWEEELQRKRVGLDLRGADLQEQRLNDLPLALVEGGLRNEQWKAASLEQRDAAAIHLEKAYLARVHLEGGYLRGAHLDGANLLQAHLSSVDCSFAYCRQTKMRLIEGRHVSFRGAYLEFADLMSAELGGPGVLDAADFGNAYLIGAKLLMARLPRADFYEAHLELADLEGAHLEDTVFRGAHLSGANLGLAHLEKAILTGADLQSHPITSNELARLRQWKPDFPEVLPSTNLYSAFFDTATLLENVTFGDKRGGFARLLDVSWSPARGANLASVNWAAVDMVGEERIAHTRHSQDGQKKDRQTRLVEFQQALRATRQLALALRSQGLSDEADYFALRAQRLQRQVARWQRQYTRWAFSLLLDVLAGYGYRLRRIVVAYLLSVATFAALYFILGLPNTRGASQLDILRDAFLVSVTAIHGRVFLEQLGQYSIQAWVAAFESVVGIVIEGVFVAMLVQRFFSGR